MALRAWPGLLVFLEISVGGGRFRGVPSCILFLSDKGKHFPLKHGGISVRSSRNQLTALALNFGNAAARPKACRYFDDLEVMKSQQAQNVGESCQLHTANHRDGQLSGRARSTIGSNRRRQSSFPRSTPFHRDELDDLGVTIGVGAPSPSDAFRPSLIRRRMASPRLPT